jgi:hypothetical protein
MTNFNLGLSAPQLAGQTDTLQKAASLFGGEDEDLAGYAKKLKEAGIEDPSTLLLIRDLQNRNMREIPQLLDRQSKLRLEEARQAQKLGKESLAYTSMMNQINNLPGTIASAFGGAGERQLTQELYGKIPEVVSETYRTFPRMQIQPVGFSAPSTRYFS